MKSSDENYRTVQVYKENWRAFEGKYKENIHMKEEYELFSHYVGGMSGKKILDVGCGFGRDAHFFNKKKANVIGVDLCKPFLKRAEELVPGAQFLEMDMINLQFDPNSFDGLWANASFLHIPRRQSTQTLSGFERVLKKNGTMLVSMYEKKYEEIVEAWIDNKHNNKPKFYSFYTEQEIITRIKECGFNINKILRKPVESVPYSWINVFATKS